MALKTFRGGVHPYEGKDLSKDGPTRTLLPKGPLVYPMSQHIGAPAVPCVAVGDTVLQGQKIAEAGGFVSSPIFASVSGTVKSIGPHRTPTGDMVPSITIESDGQFTAVEYQPVEDVKALSREQIIERIKEGGVVGMGGAGFPTHVKLSPKEPDKIDYVIVNGAECEPYLTSDYRIMLEDTERLVEGLKIMLQLFPNAQGVFGVEDNKPDCIRKLTDAVAGESRITVCPLQTKYPQGGERQLINAVTGRAINAKMLPADAGCVVDNVETVTSIYDAVKLGKPNIERVFTVTGEAVKDPANFRFLMGTSFQELLDAAGGFSSEPAKLISGGTMMGFAMFDLDVPTTKTTSALLALSHDQVREAKGTACINCGRCVEVCPEFLVPSKLAKFSDHGQTEAFEKWYGLECVECGSCSFICPAKRPLAQAIKDMKKDILAAKRKK